MSDKNVKKLSKPSKLFKIRENDQKTKKNYRKYLKPVENDKKPSKNIKNRRKTEENVETR